MYMQCFYVLSHVITPVDGAVNITDEKFVFDLSLGEHVDKGGSDFTHPPFT